MKYILMMMSVLWFYGCGTKQKLQSQSKHSSESKLNHQSEAQLHYRHATLKQQSDSAAAKQWFKIYPKGEVQFNDGNFIGQVDSLLWYASSLSLQKQWQSQQHDTIISQKQQTTASALNKSEERVKETQKQWFSWWPLMLGLLIAVIIYLIIKKMN